MPKHIKASGGHPGGPRTPRTGSSLTAPMSEDPLLIDYLLLLRFGSSNPNKSLRPLLNYASISRITKKPLSTIRALIKLGIEVKLSMLPIQRRKRKKLDQHHIDYL